MLIFIAVFSLHSFCLLKIHNPKTIQIYKTQNINNIAIKIFELNIAFCFLSEKIASFFLIKRPRFKSQKSQPYRPGQRSKRHESRPKTQAPISPAHGLRPQVNAPGIAAH